MTKTDLISVDQALEMPREKIAKQHDQYLNPGFRKMLSLLSFDRKFVSAKGTKVWDEDGTAYLDFLGGYGSLNLGHNPPAVLEDLEKVKDKPNLLQASMGVLNASLAENLAAITPGDLRHSFFCNSGAEAIEGAIKLARKATGKGTILSAGGSFHGKTMGALSVSGRDKYKKGFNPLVPDCVQVEFGDASAIQKIISQQDNVAAVLLEPIQGEAGVILPPEGYLREVKDLCQEHGVLLFADEIQTGLGRTGKMFACEHDGVVPDIMCLAKSLGGGVMPIGAYITTPQIWEKAYGKLDEALLHTSTFGGNAMASAAGISALNAIVKEGLVEQAEEMGTYFLEQLQALHEKYDFIKEIRGKGLLIGVEFQSPDKGLLNKLSQGMLTKASKEYVGAFVAEKLHNEYQIITAFTLNNPDVIRLEPPLTVTKEEIDYVVKALDGLLSKHKDFYSLALSSGKKALSSMFKRNR